MGNVFIQFDWPFYGRPEGGKKRVRMRAWEGVLARRPYACALTTVSMTDPIPWTKRRMEALASARDVLTAAQAPGFLFRQRES